MNLWKIVLPLALVLGACKKESSTINDLKPSQSLETNSTTETVECSTTKELRGVGETGTYGTFKVTDLGGDIEVTITAKTGFYITSADVVWGVYDDVNSMTSEWNPCGEIEGMYDNSFDFGETTSLTFTIDGSTLDENGCLWIGANVKVMSNVSTVRCTYPSPNSSSDWKGSFEFCRCLPPPPPPPPADCGQLKTQTPGGWGAEPHGKNPGTYLHANFDAVFPAGLSVGSFPDYHVTFDDAQDITDYIPAGGPAKKLTRNYLNPSTVSLKNNLVNHLVALTLSVKFDAADASFGTAGIALGNMEIGSGAFDGMTVNEFLAIANQVLGGTNTSYSPQDVLSTATSINENYVDGKIDNHFLVCPDNN